METEPLEVTPQQSGATDAEVLPVPTGKPRRVYVSFDRWPLWRKLVYVAVVIVAAILVRIVRDMLEGHR